MGAAEERMRSEKDNCSDKNSHLYRETLGWEGVENRQLLCFFKA
jgi:hypothetical protein